MLRTKRITKVLFMLSFVIIVAFAAAGQAKAATNTFDFDVVFSGETPGGSGPYLTATFDDGAADAGYDVRLTVHAGNLDPGLESATKLYFNLDPALDASLLTFNAEYTADSVPNSVSGADNAYKADGDGWYDVYFNMPPPTGQYGPRFTDNETLIYDIGYSGAETLDISSFTYFSVPGGAEGQYLAAAHIQNIGGNGMGSEGSGWVGVVPEPVSSTLFLVGAATLGYRRFKKK